MYLNFKGSSTNNETSHPIEIKHNTTIDVETEKMEQLCQMKNRTIEPVCKKMYLVIDLFFII